MHVGEFEIRAIVFGCLLPAAICSILLGIFVQLADRWRGISAFAGPMALAFAFCSGYFTLKLGTVPTDDSGVIARTLGTALPTETGWECVPLLGWVMIPAGWLAAYSQRKWLTIYWGALAAALAFTAIVTDWPLHPGVTQKIGGAVVSDSSKLWMVNIGRTLALTAGAVVAALLLFRMIPLMPRSLILLAMVGMMSVLGPLLFAGGNARFAQIAGVVTAALSGAAVVVAILRESRGEMALRGLIPVFAVFLVGMMYIGIDNSNETRLQPGMGLVAFSPVALAIAAIPGLRSQSVWVRATISLFALSIPLTIAAALAMFVLLES